MLIGLLIGCGSVIGAIHDHGARGRGRAPCGSGTGYIYLVEDIESRPRACRRKMSLKEDIQSGSERPASCRVARNAHGSGVIGEVGRVQGDKHVEEGTADVHGRGTLEGKTYNLNRYGRATERGIGLSLDDRVGIGWTDRQPQEVDVTNAAAKVKVCAGLGGEIAGPERNAGKGWIYVGSAGTQRRSQD